jgi:hypothetical protein
MGIFPRARELGVVEGRRGRMKKEEEEEKEEGEKEEGKEEEEEEDDEAQLLVEKNSARELFASRVPLQELFLQRKRRRMLGK